jgi:hypothetical protein
MRQAPVERIQRKPRTQPYQEDFLSKPPEGQGPGIKRPREAGQGVHSLHSFQQDTKGPVIKDAFASQRAVPEVAQIELTELIIGDSFPLLSPK